MPEGTPIMAFAPAPDRKLAVGDKAVFFATDGAGKLSTGRAGVMDDGELQPAVRRAQCAAAQVGAVAGVDDQRHVEGDRRGRRGLGHDRADAAAVSSAAPASTSNSSSSWTCSSIRAGRPRDGVRHADHRAADDVGGRALDRGVDRLALGGGGVRAAGVDLRGVDAAAEQRLDVAVLLGEGDGAVHVLADAGEALEVGVDEALGVLARDAQVVGEAEGGDAVDHPEVDRLGLAADVRGHALDRHAEHLRGGHRVDVEAVAEGLLQRLDVGDVREDARARSGCSRG